VREIRDEPRLDLLPPRETDRARPQYIRWWPCILIEAIPGAYQLRVRRLIEERGEFRCWNFVRDRPPAVPVAEERNKVRPRRDALAARDLIEADAHGALLAAGFFEDAPPEIDGLEAAIVVRAERAQARENGPLQHVPLRVQVAEGRAHEDPEDTRSGHA
jgi:hypothetical protein